MKKWSQKIKKRRLWWYGHVRRLDENTPARRTHEEAKRKMEHPRGRLSLTWLKLIQNDLGKALKGLEEIAPDKIKYKSLGDSAFLL